MVLVAALLLTIVTGWSLAWIFTFVGIIVQVAPRPVQGMSMMIMFPLTFLSNAFVPADTLPEWPWQTFVNINPVSHVVTAVRDLANDGAVTRCQVGWALFACAARSSRSSRRSRCAATSDTSSRRLGVQSAICSTARRACSSRSGGRPSP